MTNLTLKGMLVANGLMTGKIKSLHVHHGREGAFVHMRMWRDFLLTNCCYP